jgi:hypothetical protein
MPVITRRRPSCSLRDASIEVATRERERPALNEAKCGAEPRDIDALAIDILGGTNALRRHPGRL